MVPMLPADVSPLDLIALGWLFLAWAVHGLVVDRGLFGAKSLNMHMYGVRRAWMRNMLARENRMMDSMLLGHLITSVSFFASTTVLVLAGLIGVLAAAEDAHRVVMDLGFTQPGSRALFEIKVLAIALIFVFAFFAFTWSLRQFNYTVALLGAFPIARSGTEGAASPSPPSVPAPEIEALVTDTAGVLSRSLRAFNSGLRCYYYAFATLGWFVGPLMFMALVAAVTLLLLARQFRSGSYGAVKRYAAALAVRAPGAKDQSP